MTAAPLVPCPVCKSAPDRFTVGRWRTEVIACPRGCKPHPMKALIHITSDQVKGWADLSEAWNTMQVGKDADGFMTVSFDRAPLHMQPLQGAIPRSAVQPPNHRALHKPASSAAVGNQAEYMDMKAATPVRFSPSLWKTFRHRSAREQENFEIDDLDSDSYGHLYQGMTEAEFLGDVGDK